MSTETVVLDRTLCVPWMSEEELDQVLEIAREVGVQILRQPRTGLVMQQVRDAFETPFHLGEVLVTEAEVALGDHRGYGMVLGEAARGALGRACITALLEGADEVTRARILKIVERAEERRDQKLHQESELIARTRVRFDLMAGS